MPSLLDREIRSREADSFGHQHFAKALESIVESPVHTPPYSVGLLGKWGTGKSSIKSLYIESLAQDQSKINGLVRSKWVRAITFNAWRFGGEDIRRALLRHVYTELGGNEDTIMDALFNQVQKPTKIPKDWKEIWREVYDKWLWTLVQVLLVAAVLVGLTWVTAWLFRLEEEWVIVSTLAVQTLLVGMLLKHLLDAKRFAISRFATINRVELPTVSAEQYEKLLVEQILKYHKAHSDCERLVVFVDDLDRLSSDEMVSGLDAIRTFMEIPREDSRLKNLGIIFVISCDEDRVADALSNKRREAGTDLPGVILNKTDARRYLDRIFQFRLEIPPFPRQDMRSFALDKLRVNLPDIVSSVEQQDVHIEEVVSRMIHVGVQSPRNALHILNAFIESWWVAQHREREGAGTTKRGALSEGAVTGYPLALAAVCALRVDFPDFYGDLQKEPDLIPRFLDIFVHGKPISDQPERVRYILEKYAVTPKPGSEEEGRTLKDGWRPLRQYLTSVISIPWPKSLQPLLLLSQDPVSRQIGDGAQRIREAFVSGDVDGVLADLGRDKDDRKFDGQQMRWLRDLVEQLESETDDYRDNASAVLAALVDRYPEQDAAHLLVPLARRLSLSGPLRMRVGVGKIPPILRFLSPSDQKRLAGSYISDLLLTSGDIQFLHETGETPSLEEAVAMVRTVIDFALSVRSEHGLDTRDDQRLLDWLVEPNVSIGGKKDTFTFSDLEEWMQKHEGHLLPSLGARYLSVVADALQEDVDDDMDLEQTADRLESGLSDLWERGEESRQLAWEMACKYVRVSPTEANEVAQKFFRTHQGAVSATVASQFAVSAIDRVLGYIGEKGLDDVDTDAMEILSPLVASRNDLSEAATGKSVQVAIKLSEYEKTSEHAVKLAIALQKAYPLPVGQVFEAWAKRAMTDLPMPCLDMLANNFTQLDEVSRANVAVEMTKVVQSDSLIAEHSHRYQRLINGLPGEHFATEPLQSHFVAVHGMFAQRFNNPEYLKSVVPVMPKMVQYCDSAVIATMLHEITSNTSGYPESFQHLHQAMVKHWPTAEDVPSPYKPVRIFEGASNFIQNNGSHSASEAALLSMEDMLERGLIEESRQATLAQVAAIVWPYHYRTVGKVLQRIKMVPEAELIARLFVLLPSKDPEQLENLEAVWKHFAEKCTAEQRCAVVQAILGEAPQPIGSQPDGAMFIWGKFVGDLWPIIFEKLSQSGGLNDEQILRIWKQVENHVPEYSTSQIISTVSLAMRCNESTARAVLEIREDISQRFEDKDDKYELAKALLLVFPEALNLESKNRIAEWVKLLGNKAVLKNVKKETHTDADVEILLDHFPGVRHLKKLVEIDQE